MSNENELWIMFLEEYKLKHAIETGELQSKLQDFKVEEFEKIRHYNGLRVRMKYEGKNFGIYERPSHAKTGFKVGACSEKFRMNYAIDIFLQVLFPVLSKGNNKEMLHGMINVFVDFFIYVKEQIKENQEYINIIKEASI